MTNKYMENLLDAMDSVRKLEEYIHYDRAPMYQYSELCDLTEQLESAASQAKLLAEKASGDRADLRPRRK